MEKSPELLSCQTDPAPGSIAKVVRDQDREHDSTHSITWIQSPDASATPIMNPEIVMVQDTVFTLYVQYSASSDKIELQVTPNELVQEIHQILMDREETCHRTCFSLQLDNAVLDNFAELKNLDGIKDGCVLKVVEEPYTLREVRIHVRHIRDILNSLDLTDAFNGVDGASLSYVNVFIVPDICTESGSEKFGKSQQHSSSIYEPVDSSLLPCDYLLPKYSKDLPLAPLHPVSEKEKPIQCLKFVTFNHWNPPPGPRKMKGDLAYLSIITLEDKEFHITASTKGFYVNQSTTGIFNPRPCSDTATFHSLVDLMNKASPYFKRNFATLLKKRNSQHSLEKVPLPFQTYPWIIPYLEHREDSLRAEDAFSCRLGYEEHIPGQTRDWNEELQATKELSRATLPERLLRERAMFKVNSDFVSAASKGALAVVDGNIMPINPGEDSKTHMFIWNNIFFSLGFDIRDHYKDLGGDAAAYVAPANDLKGVEAYCDLDTEKLYTLGTVVLDYRGFRITGQSIIPGILEREQDQLVVYGSIDPSPPADSSGNRLIIGNEEYASLLRPTSVKLRIAPHRVSSSCKCENQKLRDTEVLPLTDPAPGLVAGNKIVELQTSYECKGIVGNDRRHYLLDLLRTFPPDLNFLQVEGFKLCKESRVSNFPRTFRHKLCCLRPELLESFVEHVLLVKNIEVNRSEKLHHVITDPKDVVELGKDFELSHLVASGSGCSSLSGETIPSSSSKDSAIDSLDVICSDDTTDEEPINTNDFKVSLHNENPDPEHKPGHELATAYQNNEDAIISKYLSSPFAPRTMKFRSKFPLLSDEIRFNSDAFIDAIQHDPDDQEKLRRERHLILDAADYLMCVQIPDLIGDWLDYVSVPIDGFTLTEAMHSRGINIRYLGVVVDKLQNIKKLDYVKKIATQEVIARAVKHVFKLIIQSVDLSHLSKATSHFLNCYLGSYPNPCPTISNHEVYKNGKKKNRRKKASHLYRNNAFSSDWISLTPSSLWKMIVKDVEQSYGTFIKEASLGDLCSSTNIKKAQLLRQFCIKCGIQIVLRDYAFDNLHRLAFQEDDILNMVSVIKHVSHKASDAHSFFLAGQTKIQQGCLREGFELISESLNLMNNVYGALHHEIASCLRLLARICYILGDRTQALLFQHKATIMSERLFGIDHSNTVTDYINLALYYVANFQTHSALKLLYRARYLMVHLSGNDHPELAALDSNLGLVLYSNGLYEQSMLYLDHALELSIKYFGSTSLKTAVIHHLLAGVYSCRGDFRTAITKEKHAFTIYKESLGESHEKTLESSACLKHLTQQAVAMQKCINAAIVKGCNANNFPSLHIQKPSLSAILDLMNLINGILFIQIKPSELEKFKELEKQLILAVANNSFSQQQQKVPQLQQQQHSSSHDPIIPPIDINGNNLPPHLDTENSRLSSTLCSTSISRALSDTTKNVVPFIIMKSAISRNNTVPTKNESIDLSQGSILLRDDDEERCSSSVKEIECPSQIIDYTKGAMRKFRSSDTLLQT